MKSKEFGASYRTYRAKSQSMLVENQLAHPHSSVRVLTESINRSPVEFMQYFRTIMEAPPKAKRGEPFLSQTPTATPKADRVEPTLSQTPTATPEKPSTPASSSPQSMFPDGKLPNTPLDPPNIRRAFNSRKNKEFSLTEASHQLLLRLCDEVKQLNDQIKRLSDKIPDETKNQIAKQKPLFDRALDTIIEELNNLRTKPIKTSFKAVAVYYAVVLMMELYKNAWPLLKNVALNMGEATGLLSLFSSIKGLIESLASSIKEVTPSTNVPPLPLPQPGGTSTTPNTPPGTSTNPATTPGTDNGTGVIDPSEAIRRKAMELLKNARLTFTALAA